MRAKIIKNLQIFFILLFYLCTPMLDSLVCADCIGHVPYQSETIISHLKILHNDVNYFIQDGSQSNTPGEQENKSFCSICANSLLGVDIDSQQVHVLVFQSSGAHVGSPLSEIQYNIYKPPQNHLV